ncbi:hypothetical protein CJT44_33660 [Pseudomonas aeruginosa]|nr:hypothetical protein CD800_16335 [Pseudomonas aeruginosa]PBY86366.1 hypothetical protein CJT44_33660 [Pseudomonas aeruginosa]PCC00519.1 hypothetical protein CJT45_33560 [Pseudomonas aeruginosa]HBO2110598.1 hypothetical protein [Pseudomonas aeruginosa]
MPDMREEFEAWATSRCVSITKAPEAMMFFGGRRVPAGCYIMADTELAWEAWQASRAALRVELPRLMKQSNSETYTDGVRAGWNACRDELQENLQQAGIEVAP